jgi:hypothetical protein
MWIRTDIPKREIALVVVLYIAANVIAAVVTALILREMFT